MKIWCLGEVDHRLAIFLDNCRGGLRSCMPLVKTVEAQSNNLENYKLSFVSQQINFGQLVANFINLLLIIGGVVAVIYLIYSGILYLTAAGNPDAAKKGQQGITNAIIGIVVILFAYAITISVSRFLNGEINRP